MHNPFKPIAVALSPNTSKEDVFLALALIIFPWNWKKWKKGKAIEELENKFKNYLGAEYAFSFASGRAGLFAILKSLDLKSGDEVITQAYTTVAVPNAIIWVGAKPAYVDIDEETFNMDSRKLEEKITPRTKAIIIQHTFGMPGKIKEILEIARDKNIFIIEDCAHSLGAEYQGEKTGTFGDAAFFSFGRDKIISSVFGGMVVINPVRKNENLKSDTFSETKFSNGASNQKILQKFKGIYKDLPYPSTRWIFQQLFHSIAFTIILPTYYFLKLGQILLFLFQKTGLLSRAYLKTEKEGKMPESFLQKLPNASAILAISQFEKLEKFNQHRMKIANFYSQSLEVDESMNQSVGSKYKLPFVSENSKHIFLYYTIQTPRRDEILNLAKKNKIILGNWFSGAIGPEEVNLEAAGYQEGDCPIAEKVGKQSLNLPTHHKITLKDAERIVEFIFSVIPTKAGIQNSNKKKRQF
jgi:dTDP-4-amino-4,6-dideoxygalactose transaminase